MQNEMFFLSDVRPELATDAAVIYAQSKKRTAALSANQGALNGGEVAFVAATTGIKALSANAIITGALTAGPHTHAWPHLLASSDATDVISRFFEWLFIQVGNLSPSTFHFPVKALLLFLMPCLLCMLYMRRHPPTVFSQVTLSVAGVLIVGALPVDRIEIANSMIKTWLWIGCTVALLFLPRLLATVVVPTVGAQRRLTISLYILLAVLFLLNTIEPGGK